MASLHSKVSAATTNATLIKNGPGRLYSVYASNVNAAARYLKFYDKSIAPTPGTDTPILRLMIPAGGFIHAPVSTHFVGGLGYSIVTGCADSDTNAVAASEILVNVEYE